MNPWQSECYDNWRTCGPPELPEYPEYDFLSLQELEETLYSLSPDADELGGRAYQLALEDYEYRKATLQEYIATCREELAQFLSQLSLPELEAYDPDSVAAYECWEKEMESRT